MVDVTVMGAGIFGLSVAWNAVQKGASVRVCDPFGPGSGSSGGLVGALAPHAPENWNAKKAFQLDSLLTGQSFWDGIDSCSGRSSGYARTGRLQPIANIKALEFARARSISSKELWPDHVQWKVISTDQIGNWDIKSPTNYAVFDTLSASINPRHAIESLVVALVRSGCEITSEAVESAGKTVWATGHLGLKEISQFFDKPAGNGIKGQSALLSMAAAGRPQIFSDGIYIVPHDDGIVAVGSTSEREFDAPDETDELLDEILLRATTILPALAGKEVVERWAGVRPRARSRAPMIGKWPGRPGHFICNGGFKIGFGMAPKAGRVMADLVLDGSDQIPAGFRVEDNLI